MQARSDAQTEFLLRRRIPRRLRGCSVPGGPSPPPHSSGAGSARRLPSAGGGAGKGRSRVDGDSRQTHLRRVTTANISGDRPCRWHPPGPGGNRRALPPTSRHPSPVTRSHHAAPTGGHPPRSLTRPPRHRQGHQRNCHSPEEKQRDGIKVTWCPGRGPQEGRRTSGETEET